MRGGQEINKQTTGKTDTEMLVSEQSCPQPHDRSLKVPSPYAIHVTILTSISLKINFSKVMRS